MKDGYFPHDINSHDDEKILKLIQSLGWEGYGLFWGIIERLHGSGGWLADDPDAIAYAMRCERNAIEKITHNFDLFVIKDGKISSNRVLKNVKIRHEKSVKASHSAKQRWYANAMPTQSERNAIKESKVKESKGKGNDTAKTSFYEGTKRPKKADDDWSNLSPGQQPTVENLRKAGMI